jgi:hypothetical protein
MSVAVAQSNVPAVAAQANGGTAAQANGRAQEAGLTS